MDGERVRWDVVRVGHASFLEKFTGETTLMGLRRESYSDRKGKTAGLFSF